MTQEHPDLDVLTALYYGFTDEHVLRAREHVASCAECRKRLADIEEERGVIAELLKRDPLSSESKAAIIRRLDGETPLHRRTIVRWAAAIAATLLVGYLVVQFLIPGDEARKEPVTTPVAVSQKKPVSPDQKLPPVVKHEDPVTTPPEKIVAPVKPPEEEKAMVARLRDEYDRLLEASRQREKALEETIARLNEELRQAQSPAALLRNQQMKIEEMSAMVDVVKRRLDQVSELAGAVDTLEADSRRLEKERAVMQEQYRDLLAEGNRRIATLDAEIAKAAAGPAATALKEEKARLVRQNESAKAAAKQYEQVCGQIREAQTAVNRQVAAFVGAGESHDQASVAVLALRSAVDGYKTRIEALKSEHARLRELIEQMKS